LPSAPGGIERRHHEETLNMSDEQNEHPIAAWPRKVGLSFRSIRARLYFADGRVVDARDVDSDAAERPIAADAVDAETGEIMIAKFNLPSPDEDAIEIARGERKSDVQQRRGRTALRNYGRPLSLKPTDCGARRARAGHRDL
jgi:hypothetical protein